MFLNRNHAGELLARELSQYNGKKNVLILAIPRGGVIVAVEVAKQLKLPLDVIIIKKLGHPGNQELAIGAVGLNDVYINKEFVGIVSEKFIEDEIKRKQEEIKLRYKLFRGDKPMYAIKNKTIILIDDGLATGATILAAIQIIKKQEPKAIIVAVPVAPPDTVQKIRKLVDKVVCLEQPYWFSAVGEFYQEFRQVEDRVVVDLLGK